MGVIGGGKHGERYLRHVPDVPGLRLVGLCRRDGTRGEAQARAAGCRFYARGEDLIADPDVAAVVLVVPPTRTVRFATAAAAAGKALLIEKPLAPTLAECATIAAAVECAQVTAMVAHTLRFNAVVVALRAALPAIGPLHAAALTQRFETSSLGWLDRRAEAGGGIILHTGVHSFDLLRHLTGDEAVRVTAFASRVDTTETEDNFAATIEMGSGLLALVGGSRATRGRSGAIELAGHEAQLSGDHVHGRAVRFVGTTSEPLPLGPPAQTVEATLVEFATALAARRAPSIGIADGAAAVALADACYRSIATGRTQAVERL
ncbi:MAG TPA: Gfo/Idh/MocA family oxidoreductase [Candidatus Binatia bacterium]